MNNIEGVRNPEERSDKDCCCGGHNHNNCKKNLNHNSTKKRLDIRKARKERELERWGYYCDQR